MDRYRSVFHWAMESMCQVVRSGSRSKRKCLQGNIDELLQIFKVDGENGFNQGKREIKGSQIWIMSEKTEVNRNKAAIKNSII